MTRRPSLRQRSQAKYAFPAPLAPAPVLEPRLEQPQANANEELLEGYEEYLGQPWGHMARLENIFSQILAQSCAAHGR